MWNDKDISMYLMMPLAWLFGVGKPASDQLHSAVEARYQVFGAFAGCHVAVDLAAVAYLVVYAVVLAVIVSETSSAVTAVVTDFGLAIDLTSSAAATAAVTDLDLATNWTCSAEIAAVEPWIVVACVQSVDYLA